MRTLCFGRSGRRVALGVTGLGLAWRSPGRSIYLAISCAEALCVVLQPLLGVAEDLVRRLDGLEFGDYILFTPLVSIRMEFEG